MRKRLWISTLAAGLLVLAGRVSADDLTGQQRLLCASVQATLCTSDGDCESDPPWVLNIPQFVEVNLADKVLSTTKASGENRSTPIRSVLREGGEIFVQGVEMGRAFSFVIEEKTGMASIAVAREGKTVSVFAACTPLPAK
jgi:hypothetical protein